MPHRMRAKQITNGRQRDACSKYGDLAMRMRRDMVRVVLCPPPLFFEFAGPGITVACAV